MQDMQQRADLIVTEIFDSELLGEGVLPSLRHALSNLAKVPSISLLPAHTCPCLLVHTLVGECMVHMHACMFQTALQERSKAPAR